MSEQIVDKQQNINELRTIFKLHFECEYGDLGSALTILKNNKDIITKVIFSRQLHVGGSYFYEACKHNRHNILKILLEYNNTVTTDKDGFTGFAKVCEKYYTDIFELLLNHNIDTEIETYKYDNAFRFACSKKYVLIIKLLLDHYEKNNMDSVLTKNVNNSFIAVCMKKNYHNNQCQQNMMELFNYLLKYNLIAEAMNNAFHWSCLLNHVEMVKLLIKYNVDLDSEGYGLFKNKIGYKIAQEKGHTNITSIIENYANNMNKLRKDYLNQYMIKDLANLTMQYCKIKYK